MPEVSPVVVSHTQYSIQLSVFTSSCSSTHQSPNQEAYRGINNAAAAYGCQDREKEVDTTGGRGITEKIAHPPVQAFAIPLKSWQHRAVFYQSEREE